MTHLTEELIVEVGIDSNGSIYVVPASKVFPHIYRAAMQVGWDESLSRLFSPPPTEWTYVQWFTQIICAASSEYNVRLGLVPATRWSNIDPSLRTAIEHADSIAATRPTHLPSPANQALAKEDWVRQMQLKDALAKGAKLWDQHLHGEYARLLEPFRHELSPAQAKKLDIAKRRGETG